MNFYNKNISGVDRSSNLKPESDNNTKYWKEVFSQKALKCTYCNLKFNEKFDLNMHSKNLHKSENKYSKCPYNDFLTDYCVLGCNFKSSSLPELRLHFVNFHK